MKMVKRAVSPAPAGKSQKSAGRKDRYLACSTAKPSAIVCMVAVMVLCGVAQVGRADTTYADGGIHDINSTIQGSVHVSKATTVNAKPGATIIGNPIGKGAITVIEYSSVNVSGGSLLGGSGDFGGGHGINALQSTVNVSGGNINGGSGIINGGFGINASQSTIRISGGNVNGNTETIMGKMSYGVRASQSTVNISGGSIAGYGLLGAGLMLESSSLARIYGGQIKGWANGNGVQLRGGNTLTVYGGQIAGDGSGYGITAASGSKVNIYGGDITGGINATMGTVLVPVFEIFGSGFNYGQGPINALSGNLSGTLADGTTFSWTFKQSYAGEIVLSPVPEPGTMAILAVGGMMALTRRQKARGNRH
jgi:hypothetical protein